MTPMAEGFSSFNPNVGLPNAPFNKEDNFVAVPTSSGGLQWKIILIDRNSC